MAFTAFTSVVPLIRLVDESEYVTKPAGEVQQTTSGPPYVHRLP
jgi:hypothetical protein